MGAFISLRELCNALLQDSIYSQYAFMEDVTDEQVSRVGADKTTQNFLKTQKIIDNKFSWQAYFIGLIEHDEFKKLKPESNINTDFSLVYVNETTSVEAASFFTSCYLEEGIVYFDSLRNYFKQHKLPLPCAIFPYDKDNTKHVFDRLPKYPAGWIASYRLDEVRHVLGELNKEISEENTKTLTFRHSNIQAETEPVAEVQDAQVVVGKTVPEMQMSADRERLKDLCCRMRAEGKTDIEIAVELWPDDCTIWINEQERLDKKSLQRERNRLEKKVGRLLPRAD